MNALGSLIKKRIKTLGLSERELAQRCKLSHSYINQLIKGVNPKSGKPISPTIDALAKLAEGLETDISDVQNAITATKRDKYIKETEKALTPRGIPVGSQHNRHIPQDLWEKIKQTQDFMACLGLDPSKHSEEDWKKLLDDLRLVVETHLSKNTLD